jgi:hypothetical protein
VKYLSQRFDLQRTLAIDEQQLKADELTIRARYASPKEQLDAAMSAEHKKLTTELDRIVNEFKARREAITHEIDAALAQAAQHARVVEEQITSLRRGLAGLQWKRARLDRENVRYSNVRIAKFIRAVAVGR